MRIGIVPCSEPSDGGVYQYSLTMLNSLRDWNENGGTDEFVVFADQSVGSSERVFSNEAAWEIQSLAPRQKVSLLQPLEAARRIVGEGPLMRTLRSLRRRPQSQNRHRLKINQQDLNKVQFQSRMSRWFEQCGVELMVYPVPQPLSFEIGIPYIMAIHDLQHRLQPEFPEVAADGEWEAREYLFRNGARFATLLLADSEVGREDILNFYGPYGVEPDQVKVLPFLPARYLFARKDEAGRERIQTKYQLPESYMFYPAQFWPHKNHRRIIEALGQLREKFGLKIPIVFCGSHTGDIRERTFEEAREVSFQMGLDKEIWYLGYIPDDDMSALYSEAVALIMPTFFGPTNIPILEAWALDCPVLTSDIRGVREQVGQAAILVDPCAVGSIADGIHKLWTDDPLRQSLIERGRERLTHFTPEEYRQRLISIFEEAKLRVLSQRRIVTQ